MQRIDDSDSEIDDSEMEQWLAKTKHEVQSKDIILFFGKTRSGVSTAINYLKGTDYKKKLSKRGTRYLEKIGGEKEFAKVSHKIASETFVPQAVLFQGNNYYVDFPGYAGNRSDKPENSARILRLTAIQKARSIQGIIICLPFYESDFITEGLFKLITFLNTQVKDFSQLPTENLLFLITKSSKITLELFSEAVKEAQEFKQTALQNYQIKKLKKQENVAALQLELGINSEIKENNLNDLRVNELRKDIAVLEKIANCAIIILQPTDRGASRDKTKEILSRLVIQQPIPKDHFNLPPIFLKQKDFLTIKMLLGLGTLTAATLASLYFLGPKITFYVLLGSGIAGYGAYRFFKSYTSLESKPQAAPRINHGSEEKKNRFSNS